MLNVIYFHICTIGRWETVVNHIFNLIQSSGLINNIHKIYVSILGTQYDRVKEILNHPKVEIFYYSQNCKLYERPCLLKIRSHSENTEFNVLYIHSKGVSRGRQTSQVDDWTKYMCYFLITQHERCLELLENYDTVGVNIQSSKPAIDDGRVTSHPYAETSCYYSGNFWWAKSSHIKKLPKTIGPQYLDSEFWIGTTTGSKMVSRWCSEIDHYRSHYPLNKYQNKENLVIREI